MMDFAHTLKTFTLKTPLSPFCLGRLVVREKLHFRALREQQNLLEAVNSACGPSARNAPQCMDGLKKETATSKQY